MKTQLNQAVKSSSEIIFYYSYNDAKLEITAKILMVRCLLSLLHLLQDTLSGNSLI